MGVHAVMSAAVVVNANTSCIIIPGDNDVSDSELFPTSILSDLDISNAEAKFEPPLSIKNPGDDLRIRALCLEDYDRGFLQILGQLTTVGEISREQWVQRWGEMKQCPDTYYVIVSVASLLAVKLGCYKVTLNCDDAMIKFYSSLGYKSEAGNSNYMCIRIQN